MAGSPSAWYRFNRTLRRRKAGRRISVKVKGDEAPFAHLLKNGLGSAELWSTDLLFVGRGLGLTLCRLRIGGRFERWRLIESYTAELEDCWPEFAAELPYLLKGIICVDTRDGEVICS